MQYLDLDTKMLFNSDAQQPISRYEREFSLFNVKKKKKFIDKLLEIYKHQKIKERIELLYHHLEKFGATPKLIKKYQDLDAEIVIAIKAAARSTGRKDFGYQRSPALVEAGQKIILHKAIQSCLYRKVEYSDKAIDLATRLNVEIPKRENLTKKIARKNVTDAILAKKEVAKRDGEIRTEWLTELAEEKAREKDTKAEDELKKMISVSRQKTIQSQD